LVHPHPEERDRRLLAAKSAEPEGMPTDDNLGGALFDKIRAILTLLWRQVLAVLQQLG